MKLIVALLLSSIAALGQTGAAQSSLTPKIIAYVPGIGLILINLDSSVTITCPTPPTIDGCLFKASVPSSALTQVVCEPHPVTTQQNVFILGNQPVGPVQVIKNGLYLMNIGGLDYSVSGSTVTLTQAQTAQPGNGVCFTYFH